MNYNTPIILLTLLLLACQSALGQVSGTVTDDKNTPLAFANIYLEGTTTGTTTNENGKYTLNLPNGEHRLMYQYVGYQPQLVLITVNNAPIQRDVILKNEAVDIKEIVVSASAEDPAYTIIRKAIKKRKYYKKLLQSYECNAYIKGNHKLVDSPKKLMGKEIGSMGGRLDSAGQGIIYLSESQSKVYKAPPNKIKEIMYSARVSGSDNGFGFNRASMMDFNFYDSHIHIQRAILSPLANNALALYDYKLIGSFYDKNGLLINKIEVIRKRENDPSFFGHIYIVEDLWNIQSVELSVTGDAIMQPLLDTMTITQLHIPVQAPDVWMQISQKLDFTFGLMGFKFQGYFTGIFSDYIVNPSYDKGFFNAEVLKINAGANEKKQVYWDSIRPIPLTIEEVNDYTKKDSLKVLWRSKPFLDSMDREGNRFSIVDTWLGYTYENSYKRQTFYVNSPIASFLYNPIQGSHVRLETSYKKAFDDYNMRYHKTAFDLQYGFSDKKFRGGVRFEYNFNKTHFTKLFLQAGYLTRQFNQHDYVYEYFSSTTSSFQHKNYIHFYDRKFGAVKLEHEIYNGILFNGGIDYEDRSYLENTSNSSYFYRDRVYRPNNSILPESGSGAVMTPHQALILSASLKLTFRQKYLTYPKRKYIIESEFPTVWLHYQKGIPMLSGDADFDEIAISIEDEQPLGLLGNLEYLLSAGQFLRKNNLRFMDFKHFKGNQFLITEPHKHYNMFFLLPYYDYSTDQPWAEAHIHHGFEGFILDKIPFINRLKWKLEVGFSGLYVKDQPFYNEWKFGLYNLGFGPLRIFRLDYSLGCQGGKVYDRGFNIGVSLPTSVN